MAAAVSQPLSGFFSSSILEPNIGCCRRNRISSPQSHILGPVRGFIATARRAPRAVFVVKRNNDGLGMVYILCCRNVKQTTISPKQSLATEAGADDIRYWLVDIDKLPSPTTFAPKVKNASHSPIALPTLHLILHLYSFRDLILSKHP